MKNDTYNLSSGTSTSIADVAKKICELLSSKSKIILKSSRTGEVTRYKGDISKIISFGWKPKIIMNEGLKKSVEWYNRHMPNF